MRQCVCRMRNASGGMYDVQADFLWCVHYFLSCLFLFPTVYIIYQIRRNYNNRTISALIQIITFYCTTVTNWHYSVNSSCPPSWRAHITLPLASSLTLCETFILLSHAEVNSGMRSGIIFVGADIIRPYNWFNDIICKRWHRRTMCAPTIGSC